MEQNKLGVIGKVIVPVIAAVSGLATGTVVGWFAKTKHDNPKPKEDNEKK